MSAINISQEQTNLSNQESTPFSKYYFLNDIGLFIFSTAFVAISSHMLNKSAVLTFTEQLAVINKPNFSGLLLMLFGVLFAFKTLYSCFSTAINGEELTSHFSSIWAPIKFIMFTGLFLPFEKDGVTVSPIVETIKLIVQLVAN